MRRFLYVLITFIALVPSMHSASAADETSQHIITRGSRSWSNPAWTERSKNVTADCPHAWSVTKTTLHSGREAGVELLTIDNGKLQIVLCPTRGMGILNVTMGDIQLKWDSPVTEIVNPAFVNLNSRGGLGWLEGFNEFMCRCGLESNGHPGTDRFINNVGDQAEMELTLHGKIANIPASNVEVAVDKTAPFAIRVRGQVNEKMLFGPKLELHTELVVVPGEDSFLLNDDIRNVGAQQQEFQILYHTNFGSPLLQEGARVVVPAKSVTPFNDRAADGMDNWEVYGPPTTGFTEQVYLLELDGDDNNHTTALLRNKAGDQAASISWSLDELPYLTVWKNSGALADGYVTGIEPGTNFPNNRSVERAAGRVPKLKPGERRSMTVKFALHNGIDNVEAAIKAVELIPLSGKAVDDPQRSAIPKR
ncbi:MAG: aldose 1-epimerase family protein [Planctomycetaceae bacterium]